MLDTLALLVALLVLVGAPTVGVLIAADAPRREAARHRTVAGALTARPRAIAITDARTGTAHLVTDEAAARGRPHGRYVAVCGARVLAASLTAPEAGECATCRPLPGEPGRAAPPEARHRRIRHRVPVLLRPMARSDDTRILPIVPASVDVSRSERATRRDDLAALAVALGFAAAVTVTGVVLSDAVLAGQGPLYAVPLPHVGPGTPVAIAVAIAVIARGPQLAQQWPWPRLLAAGYAAAVAWTLSLALVDGWGWFTSRLTSPQEYLSEVGGVTDVGAMLAGFTARIPDGSPGIWATHVAGHPPGAFLVFIGLDRVGLGGGVAASLACVLVGGLAAVAVPVTLRALGDEPAARAVVPFAALFPGAVWVGASADGLFAGVTATGVALLALACAGRAPRHDAAALGGGVVLGYGLYLSYGLTLMALPVLAVALVTRRLRPLLVGGVGVAAVVLTFTASGFWWLDGYSALVVRYHAGIAADRPYAFWVFANLACLLVVAGPLVVRAVLPALRCWRTPAAALFLAAAAAVMLADVSGLSKAETERIWLPFAVWLLAGAALLPPPSRRFWLVAGACAALGVNHFMLTAW